MATGVVFQESGWLSQLAHGRDALEPSGLDTATFAEKALRNDEMMAKRDKEQVNYKPGRCCYHCASFMPPPAPPQVEGYCVRVRGEIHPGSCCDLHKWASDDDGDGDLRPDNHKRAHPSITLSDGHLRPQLCDGHERGRFLSTSEN